MQIKVPLQFISHGCDFWPYSGSRESLWSGRLKEAIDDKDEEAPQDFTPSEFSVRRFYSTLQKVMPLALPKGLNKEVTSLAERVALG